MPCGPDKHLLASNRTRCCDFCPEGQYVQADCDEKTPTKCAVCEHGHYTVGKNYLTKCLPCKACPDNQKLVISSECQANRNRQCKCMEGFYCQDEDCEHCIPVTKCARGDGVEKKHTSKTDTVCSPCRSGYYNNVTDFNTRCVEHTNCESLGQELVTPGTNTSDAKCKPFENTGCHWIIPASLWAGFVIFIILVLIIGYLCWRSKRHSSMTVPHFPEKPIHLPLVLHENELEYPVLCHDDKFNNHPPSCPVQIDEFKEPSEIECDGGPTTVWISAESFIKPPVCGDGTVYLNHTSVCHSEPQEDEWSEI